MGGDRETDLLESGDFFRVDRMGAASKGQGVDPVESRFVEGKSRRIDHDPARAVLLQQRSSAPGVGFGFGETKGFSVSAAIGGNGLEGRQLDGLALRFHRNDVGSAGDIAEIGQPRPGGEAGSYIKQWRFAHAEDEEIGLAVDKDGAADGVIPVIVMGQPPQTPFDPTNDHRHPLEGPLDRGGIGNQGPVGTGAALSSRSIGVVVADFLGGGVVADHGVHGAGGDGDKEARPAHAAQGFGITPVRLGKDADAIACGFEETGEEWHAKGGMINVGVPGDEEDVKLVPSPRRHVGAADGKKVVRSGGVQRPRSWQSRAQERSWLASACAEKKQAVNSSRWRW